jgi:hypothetical protein
LYDIVIVDGVITIGCSPIVDMTIKMKMRKANGCRAIIKKRGRPCSAFRSMFFIG